MSPLTRRVFLGVAVPGVIPKSFMSSKAQATPIAAPAPLRTDVPISMLIHNAGADPEALTSARSPIAQAIALHATHLEHGQRVMHDVSEISIPAESFVSLEPGAMHLMLIGLETSLVQGQVFPLTLTFAGSGEVQVEGRVRRKQDAAGVPATPPVSIGSITILHASAPPAPVAHG